MAIKCSCIKAPAVDPRKLRKCKVIHTVTGNVIVLAAPKAPGKWSVLVTTSTSSGKIIWRVGYSTSRSLAVAGNHFASAYLPAGYPIEELDATNIASLQATFKKEGVSNFCADVTIRTANRIGSLSSAMSGPSVTPPPLSGPLPTLLAKKEKKESKAYTARATRSKATTPFTPPPINHSAYWYESERDSKFLEDFIAMRKAEHVTNLMVVGPSGFGKTVGILNLAKRLGIPAHVVNCQAITTPEKWLGQMQFEEGRGTYFDMSNHLKWVERSHPDCEDHENCIILYDEITRLRSDLGNMTFSLLDTQGGLEVPQLGRRVLMDKGNIVIATANIGTPYAGTFQMDWALRGRFDMQLERTSPPEDEEIKIIRSATSEKLTNEDAQALVRVAEHTRSLWMNGELESPISTRSLVSWARLVAGGYTVKEGADYTILPLYSEDGGAESDRARVKMALDAKVSEIGARDTANRGGEE